MTPLTPEVEAVIRERVKALPHGQVYRDYVSIDDGLMVSKRTLLKVLGCDVSDMPAPADPFDRAERGARSWTQKEMTG